MILSLNISDESFLDREREESMSGLLSPVLQRMTSPRSYEEPWGMNNTSCFPVLRLGC